MDRKSKFLAFVGALLIAGNIRAYAGNIKHSDVAPNNTHIDTKLSPKISPKKNSPKKEYEPLGKYVDEVCTTDADFQAARAHFEDVLKEVELHENRKLIFDTKSYMLHWYPGENFESQFDEDTNTISGTCVYTKKTNPKTHKVVQYYNLAEIFSQLERQKRSITRDIAIFLYGKLDKESRTYKGIFEDPLYSGPPKKELFEMIKNQYLGIGYSDERKKFARKFASESADGTFFEPLAKGDLLEMKLKGKPLNIMPPELKKRQMELVENYMNDEKTQNYTSIMDDVKRGNKDRALAVTDYAYNVVDEVFCEEMFAVMAESVFYQAPLKLTFEEYNLFAKMKYNNVKLFPLTVIDLRTTPEEKPLPKPQPLPQPMPEPRPKPAPQTPHIYDSKPSPNPVPTIPQRKIQEVKLPQIIYRA